MSRAIAAVCLGATHYHLEALENARVTTTQEACCSIDIEASDSRVFEEEISTTKLHEDEIIPLEEVVETAEALEPHTNS